MESDFHEVAAPHERAEGPSNRSFGLTVGGILVAIGIARWGLYSVIDTVTAVLATIGSILVLLGAVLPSALTSANRAWMRFGELLAKIVNPIIMFLIFAVSFVPIGLFLRLRGHDPLGLESCHDAESYWISRPPSEPASKGMVNQY